LDEHDEHAELEDASALPETRAAKVDIRRVMCPPEHEGHWSPSPLLPMRQRASNLSPHSLQRNS